MVALLFNKDQNEIFERQKEDCGEESFIWKLINIVFPIFIIIFPIILISFLPDEKKNFQNLILNGSLSLLSINILFSMF